jgi:hypothetical protein
VSALVAALSLALLAQAGPWVAPPAAADGGVAPADHKDPVTNSAAAGAADAGAADAGPVLAEATPLSVNAAVTPVQVTLGQPFNYALTIRHDPADAYSLPADPAAPFNKTGIEPRGEPQVARTATQTEARTVFTFPLAVTGTMKPELPAIKLHVQGPAGPRVYTVQGQKVDIQSLVDQEGQGAADHAHHGPKAPEPVWMRSWLWAWVLAAIAIIVFGIVTVRKLRKKQAEEAARPPPPPLPHDVAFSRLKALRLRAPWQSGAGRAAIFELSEIVRVYLGQRLSFGAIDLTSDELLKELKAREAAGVQGLELAALEKQLQWEDLVKFARVEPAAEECLAAIDASSALVERTQERMVKERHAELVSAGAAPGSGAGAGTAAATGEPK